jgi:hypothetical protein
VARWQSLTDLILTSGLLVVLGLGRNNLGQTIPTEIGRLRKLNTLGLEKNSLTGPIPSEMGGMNSMSKFLLVERSASRVQVECRMPPYMDELIHLSSPHFRTAQFGL